MAKLSSIPIRLGSRCVISDFVEKVWRGGGGSKYKFIFRHVGFVPLKHKSASFVRCVIAEMQIFGENFRNTKTALLTTEV